MQTFGKDTSTENNQKQDNYITFKYNKTKYSRDKIPRKGGLNNEEKVMNLYKILKKTLIRK